MFKYIHNSLNANVAIIQKPVKCLMSYSQQVLTLTTLFTEDLCEDQFYLSLKNLFIVLSFIHLKNFQTFWSVTKVDLGPGQTSKMKRFLKARNG